MATAVAEADHHAAVLFRSRLAIAVLAAALAAPIVASDAAAAGEDGTRPRVEDVAVRAVAELGDDAPAAVLGALAEGKSLERVVRAIERGTLVLPAPSDSPAGSTTTSPAPAADGESPNPVVTITDRRVEPASITVNPNSPLIVANRGDKVHVVEIKGTDLQKYSLEPGQVGVYELDGVEPGRYTLRCIVAGHTERTDLTVPSAPPANLRAPVGSMGVRSPAAGRARVGGTPGLTADDYREIIDALNDATDVALAAGQQLPPDDGRELRRDAEQAREKVIGGRTVTADPSRV